MNKFLKIWSVLTIIFMTFVVFGGALVTKTGSADGCGNSWPLCNGQLVRLTDITPEKLIEVAHRMTTGLASIFVIVLAILAWRTIKDRRETKPLAIIAVLFLILQAFMGQQPLCGDKILILWRYILAFPLFVTRPSFYWHYLFSNLIVNLMLETL
ncbi:cytochrome oxidase assembly protein [Listeria fleischmannii FSL S10-1203]|uniref:Cytochrome oxidase assembly protein n=1 Tax=Listeria fleischmannii FSL S10-1203 TaxID=1265822 RepID=W7DQP2_9LIST|nr:cytochrome oxidase assembly protein [Listeria fleischmannii FSL S10-1203]